MLQFHCLEKEKERERESLINVVVVSLFREKERGSCV